MLSPSVQQPAVVSVALCTCNGERFLQQQLDSIARQTQLPDELVITDDRSTDRTHSIIRQFAETVSFPVVFEINTERRGSTSNFDTATAICRGDIILLCDQDDVWYPNKLATLSAFLQKHPEHALVFTNAHLVNDNLERLPGTLWHALKFTHHQRQRIVNNRAFDTLLRRNVVTGATMAIRKNILTLASPFPSNWYHDNWVALIAASTAKIGAIDEPLMMYRQHSSNQIGASDTTLAAKARVSSAMKRDHYEFLVSRYELLLAKLSQSDYRPSSPAEHAAQLHGVEQKIEHLTFRASLNKGFSRRLAAVLKEGLSGRYFRYSMGMKSLAKDILFRNS